MISVIIPTYNRSTMLRQAIESVEKQAYKDVEIIVLDDNSTDNTEQTVRALQQSHRNIKYIKNDINQGPGANRNKGFCFADGDYIVFMDDDDYYTNDSFFSNAINIFSQEENVACVSANANIENTVTKRIVPGKIGVRGLVSGNKYLMNLNGCYKKPLSTFAAVFAKRYLDMANLSNMKMVNDVSIYMRALVYGDMYVLPECVGNYRVHGNNISSHIERDFMIANMNERLWTAKRLKGNKAQIADWLDNQLLFCYSYYVRGTHPSLYDNIVMIAWIISKTRPSMKLYKGIMRIIIKDRKRNLH